MRPTVSFASTHDETGCSSKRRYCANADWYCGTGTDCAATALGRCTVPAAACGVCADAAQGQASARAPSSRQRRKPFEILECIESSHDVQARRHAPAMQAEPEAADAIAHAARRSAVRS